MTDVADQIKELMTALKAGETVGRKSLPVLQDQPVPDVPPMLPPVSPELQAESDAAAKAGIRMQEPPAALVEKTVADLKKAADFMSGAADHLTPRQNLSVLRPGYYRHYKGGSYEVLGTALCCETKRVKVLYRSVNYGTLWVRDLDDFMSQAKCVREESGVTTTWYEPRFVYQSPAGNER